MRHIPEFKSALRPYAVDLGSLQAVHHRPASGRSPELWNCSVQAVWFRRRQGRTIVCTGALWDFLHSEPKTAVEFLEECKTGRYGGNCTGRWDGEKYWGEQAPEAIADDLALLRPALENYPAAPEGFDGWWTFKP
jgi:hypothetical protein